MLILSYQTILVDTHLGEAIHKDHKIGYKFNECARDTFDKHRRPRINTGIQKISYNVKTTELVQIRAIGISAAVIASVAHSEVQARETQQQHHSFKEANKNNTISGCQNCF